MGRGFLQMLSFVFGKERLGRAVTPSLVSDICTYFIVHCEQRGNLTCCFFLPHVNKIQPTPTQEEKQ